MSQSPEWCRSDGFHSPNPSEQHVSFADDVRAVWRWRCCPFVGSRLATKNISRQLRTKIRRRRAHTTQHTLQQQTPNTTKRSAAFVLLLFQAVFSVYTLRRQTRVDLSTSSGVIFCVSRAMLV